jgi:uncharacterized glyoxalase superfamily protein PhnB
MSPQSIYAAIRYADADAALAFLKSAFGATERAVHRDDAGTIRHGELEIAGSLVMIGQYGDEPWMGGESPRPLASTISLYVVVSDPDAHHARAVAAGATVVRELEDMDYGSREYSVRDPEGNLWSFGTYDPSGAADAA